MITKNKQEIEFNYNQFKERAEHWDKNSRKILLAVLKSFPREDIIKVLKELKIIKYELVGNNKFNYVEVGK